MLPYRSIWMDTKKRRYQKHSHHPHPSFSRPFFNCLWRNRHPDTTSTSLSSTPCWDLSFFDIFVCPRLISLFNWTPLWRYDSRDRDERKKKNIWQEKRKTHPHFHSGRELILTCVCWQVSPWWHDVMTRRCQLVLFSFLFMLPNRKRSDRKRRREFNRWDRSRKTGRHDRQASFIFFIRVIFWQEKYLSTHNLRHQIYHYYFSQRCAIRGSCWCPSVCLSVCVVFICFFLFPNELREISSTGRWTTICAFVSMSLSMCSASMS